MANARRMEMDGRTHGTSSVGFGGRGSGRSRTDARRSPVVEALEERVLWSVTALPNASSVTLTRRDGTSQAVSRRKDTWIIVHGLLSSKDAAGIKILAAAVDGSSPDDQVLMVDWRQLAVVTDVGRVTQANAQATANVVAARIAALGLRASRINLIGFSMGGLVVDRIAKALHGRGGVNAIVALDPSSPKLIDGKGRETRAAMNLKGDSRYSIAFHGVDIGSPFERAVTADDTIRIDHIGDLATARHAGVFDVFTNMTKINNLAAPDRVSSIFSLERIKAADMPLWKKDEYDKVDHVGGYEAVITAKGVPGTLRPKVLTFVDTKSGDVRRTLG